LQYFQFDFQFKWKACCAQRCQYNNTFFMSIPRGAIGAAVGLKDAQVPEAKQGANGGNNQI